MRKSYSKSRGGGLKATINNIIISMKCACFGAHSNMNSVKKYGFCLGLETANLNKDVAGSEERHVDFVGSKRGFTTTESFVAQREAEDPERPKIFKRRLVLSLTESFHQPKSKNGHYDPKLIFF